ncbi:bifunctional cytidylate kinase/GTPase Der [Alloscardovia theropitheci]|uniref:Multifunctional fusion protein n=1 Tax=Alloscardovia theropitheci TaxID=2496842 RepID=A0A4R0QTD6_9BIFI|nr:bifunctional cytidylate kinase/GTPase Der [Alloscardovia theropitheci]TCD54788.1 bifunctional cytidylate kinase/GTPase Der [Alloscardovia theropitheci]
MITVAIDGPSGVGKSSTSRALAQHFGYAYLDTGAMYRACAWWCMDHGEALDMTDTDSQTEHRLTELVAQFFTDDHFDISLDPSHPGVFCDGKDLSEVIRSDEVAQHVSAVSSIIPIRNLLIAAQRAYIAGEENPQGFSNGAGIVVEGRDITSVVAPDAEVRVLLTAREDVRQQRRNKQNSEKTVTSSDTLSATSAISGDDVAARDAKDSQVTSFLEAGDGVTTVDNSDMSFEQTLQVLIDMVDNAIDEQLFGTYVDNLNEYELEEGDEAYLTGDELEEHDNDDAIDNTVGVLAVVGRPNVGKSTLVNRILGRRAAIVEDTPGVTRDRVTYEAEWSGTRFQLVDTGGWEADVEGIDSAIASQAQIAVQLADAVLLVVDGIVGLTASDERIVSMLRAAGKPVVVAVNKLDTQMLEYQAAEFWNLGLGEPYAISAMHGRGVGDLLDVALKKLAQAEKTSGLLTPTHLRRVALVGRPNVGKSSLLNQLSGENRAVVSDIAGTTRDPVDEVVNVGGEDWLFIDTAGIKRRLHKQSGADYYSSLRTQAAIERSELALVLFDVSQPISDQDLKVMSQAVDAGRAVVLVFNKWDLLDDFGRQRIERLWATEFNRVTWAQRINLSALTGWHTNRLKLAMDTALENWEKRISTGRLNSFLGQLQAAHPHPLRGGKQPRILFATQASSRPPRFVIFTTGFLDHSYRRFIEHSLRDEFGFEGTPIQISINVREKKKRK